MAVTGTTSETEYTGDGGTTRFPTVFRFLDQADLVVTVTPAGGGAPVVQTLGIHYTVDGVGADAGGNVNFIAAPAVGDLVTVERNTPIVQDIHFALQGDFFPETHEEAFDQGTMIDQELERRVTALENSGTTNNAVAGNGLAVAGSTWNVGAGAGIQSNADDIAVVYGVAVNVANVSKAAAAAGVRNEAARIDHKHDITTAAPGDILIGDGAVEGVSGALARADHQHQLAAPGAAPPAVSGAAGAEGASGLPARADHTHQVTMGGAPPAIAAVGAAGASNSSSRSDHTHAHGAQALGDGTNHAVATNAFAGFMSAADKSKLDGFPNTFTGTVQTTTVAQTVVASTQLPAGTTELLEVLVSGVRNDGTQGAGYRMVGTFRKASDVAAAVQVGATVKDVMEDVAAWDVGFRLNADGKTIEVYVVGVDAITINWRARGRICEAP
jgi:hypothetical protein